VTLKVEPKLRDVLIPLSKEKYEALEADILQNGCIQPIVVWNGTIVDGHNRYEICQKHGIPFDTVEHQFDSLAEARIWVWSNLKNTREPTDFQKCEMVMSFKEDLESEALKRVLSGHNLDPRLNLGEDPTKRRTDFLLGQMAGVSHDIMRMAIRLHDQADDQLLEKLRSGNDMKISAAYRIMTGKAPAKKKKDTDIDELRDYDPNANPFIGDIGDLRGIEKVGAHYVHVETPMEDNPESFPMVERLFDDVFHNFIVSLENAFQQFSPGMRTPENMKNVENMIRNATRQANALKKKYLKEEKKDHE